MCVSSRTLRPILGILLTGAALMGQTGAGIGAPAQPEWSRVGNSSLDVALASLAGGPVERVWYSDDGSRLYALTVGGTVFETADFERWVPSEESEAPPEDRASIAPGRLPEPGATTRISSRINTCV